MKNCGQFGVSQGFPLILVDDKSPISFDIHSISNQIAMSCLSEDVKQWQYPL